MASKLFKTVKKKAGRLQDIVSVLQKLEDKKYVERLSKIFEEIFYEEQKFTITELQRIMSSKPANKYLDLDEQFKQNTQLFKANFEVISGILINEVWDNVTDLFTKHPEEKQEESFQDRSRPSISPKNDQDVVTPKQQQGVGSESTANENEQNQGQQVYQTNSAYEHQTGGGNNQNNVNNNNNNNNNINAISNEQKRQSKAGMAKSQVINNSSYSMNTSYTQANHNDNWVRSSMKIRNSSRSQENIKQQLPPTINDSQYGKRMSSMNNSTINNKTNQSILDIKKQSEKKLNNMNLSISSVKSLSQSKLGIPTPFSELPDHKNPLQTSFSRAQRKLLDKQLSQSPGPLDYRVDKADKLTRKQSPKASFGNTTRSSFIDDKQRFESNGSTPGPQYNTSQANIYKPMKK